MKNLIISFHIPKTAGSSFNRHISNNFGREKIFFDYIDPDGCTKSIHLKNGAEIKEIFKNQGLDQDLNNYYLIHGHITAPKYINVFPDAKYLTWFRDPVQRIVSHYYYYLRAPLANDLQFADKTQIKVKGDNYTIEQFVNETIGLKNLYSKVIEGLNINDLAFIGITEEFEKSLLLFNKIFNCQKQLPAKKYNAKVNPHKESSGYIISDQTKKAITRENQKDILLYAQAKKRFEELCNIHGV